MATTMRGFGAQNVMLMRNESTPDSLVAMLASCTSMGLQVSHSVGGLEDAVVGCGMKRSFSYPSFVDGSPGEEAGLEDGVDDCSPNVEKKRRLTFDQVRSLERNFELENKLEPEKKMQLAKELGLQPRQVAVWFQNRRARWKTKQLERDYEVLSQDYNRLKTEYDAVVLEKEKLETEIQHLTGKTQPINAESRECANVEPSISGVKTTDPGLSKLPRADSVVVKAERTSEVVQTRDSQWSKPSPTVEIPEKDQTTSSASNSSEILDTDSPRTIDNYKLSPVLQQQQQLTDPQTMSTSCQQFAGDQSFIDPSLLQVAAGDLCAGRVLSPQVYHRVAIKLEDGNNYQDVDQSCNYFLSQLDDKGATPWWDWA